MAHTPDAIGARGTQDLRGASRRTSRSTVACRRRSSHAWTPHAWEGAWRERMEQAWRMRACATTIRARGCPRQAARRCESAAHPRGVSRTAAVSGASSLPPHIERGSARRTGRARHGRDTLPLDNLAHRRDNGWKSLWSPQAMSPRAPWRALMTVYGMHREASIDIQASPEAVYDLVSDLPRMGEWGRVPEPCG